MVSRELPDCTWHFPHVSGTTRLLVDVLAVLLLGCFAALGPQLSTLFALLGRWHSATPLLSTRGHWAALAQLKRVCQPYAVRLPQRHSGQPCLFVDPRLLGCLGLTAVNRVCFAALLSGVGTQPPLFVDPRPLGCFGAAQASLFVNPMLFGCLGATAVNHVCLLTPGCWAASASQLQPLGLPQRHSCQPCLFVDPRLLGCLGATAVNHVCLLIPGCWAASAPQLSNLAAAVCLPCRLASTLYSRMKMNNLGTRCFSSVM